MSDGFIPPIKSKRPKNTKGLSLTAESLAPPPLNADEGSDQDYDLNAYVTQATPRPLGLALADEEGKRDDDDAGSSGHTLMPPKVSKVSRKKPAGLGIKSTRPAPEAPGNGLTRDGEVPSPGSTHSMSSRAEMERELASMEISSSSSRSGSKHPEGNGSSNGKESKSSSGVKKTRKKSEKSNGTTDSGHGFPELRDEDLKVVGDLGAGNGGTVNKVLHKETGLYMAKKVSSPCPAVLALIVLSKLTSLPLARPGLDRSCSSS